jgi:hypothetical protein
MMRVTEVVQAMPHLVPLPDFIVSPGFAGVAAVVAAVIALCAVLYGSRRGGKRFNQDIEQRERHSSTTSPRPWTPSMTSAEIAAESLAGFWPDKSRLRGPDYENSAAS